MATMSLKLIMFMNRIEYVNNYNHCITSTQLTAVLHTVLGVTARGFSRNNTSFCSIRFAAKSPLPNGRTKYEGMITSYSIVIG